MFFVIWGSNLIIFCSFSGTDDDANAFWESLDNPDSGSESEFDLIFFQHRILFSRKKLLQDPTTRKKKKNRQFSRRLFWTSPILRNGELETLVKVHTLSFNGQLEIFSFLFQKFLLPLQEIKFSTFDSLSKSKTLSFYGSSPFVH